MLQGGATWDKVCVTVREQAPLYLPTLLLGGGPETESKGTLRDSPFAHEKSTVCQEALFIPPILARLGEERSKDGVIIQLITANQRYLLGRAD